MLKTSSLLIVAFVSCSLAWAADKSDSKEASSSPKKSVFSLLPKSFQKNPRLDFNILTEVSASGKKLGLPTAEKPSYYVIQVRPAESHGLVPDEISRNAPKPEQIERLVGQALRGNHYLPHVEGGPRPTLVLIVHWGSYSSPALGADTLIDDDAGITVQEKIGRVLGDIPKRQAVIERARLSGGETFARELNDTLNQEVALRRASGSSDTARLGAAAGGNSAESGSMLMSMLEASSPLALYMRRDPRTEAMVEEVFSDSYYVVVSAVDYDSLAKKAPVKLWRTKMSINSIGVSVAETVAPLIDAGAQFLGRETERNVIISKRISREGRVELGDAIVKDYVEPDAKPTPQTDEKKK